jgi:ligand-binding sensor protein
MVLRYNVERLQKVINDFNVATGISVSILDIEYNHIAGGPISANCFCKLIHSTDEGKRRCIHSDKVLLNMAKEQKRAVTRRCHAGLADAVVPIYNRDILLGFIIFGQIDVSDGKRTPFDEIYERVKDLDIDREALKAAYENSVFSDRKKIDSAAEIVSILTKYILFEHLIELEREKTSDGVARYIDENIA